MPAGMVRPRASQVPPLGAGAIADYVQSGWHRTEGGGVDTGQRIGPCGGCQEPTVLYGPFGRPLCRTCDPARPAFADITPAERAAAGICVCGHHELHHELHRPRSGDPERRKCRTGGPTGACPCTRYTRQESAT